MTEKDQIVDVDQLLAKLKIGESRRIRKDRQFEKELQRTPFSIFACVADHGYFSWAPQGKPHKAMEAVTVDDVIDGVNLEGQPNRLVSISSLRLPQMFRSLPPQEHKNSYPYGQIDIACLHVAFRHRGLKAGFDDNCVDFAFGGSTLEMLAKQDSDSPYMATRIPNTKTILVVKTKDYVHNFADFGFQFERFVTGRSFSDRPEIEFVEHMHVMKVGKYRVLFRAETDAMDEYGEPVEVTSSNPNYWGTKVMFQMMSSGSSKLCHGIKGRGTLVRINMMGLSDVTTKALRNHESSVRDLQQNILSGMDDIQKEMEYVNDGEVFNIEFGHGGLRLHSVSNRALLPPRQVVEDLIAV